MQGNKIVTNREIRDLWELFICAHRRYGDPSAQLLLKTSMQSALLAGIRQGITNPPEGDNPAITFEPAKLDIDVNIERWWSSIRISQRYADPPLAFYCFEKALEIVRQKGVQLVNEGKNNGTNSNTR